MIVAAILFTAFCTVLIQYHIHECADRIERKLDRLLITFEGKEKEP